MWLTFRYTLLLLGMTAMLVISIKFLLSARIDSTSFNRDQGTLTLSRYSVLTSKITAKLKFEDITKVYASKQGFCIQAV